MDKALTRMSRLLALSGVASIVFGATVLLWPGISLVTLTLLFGAFAFVYGTFAIGGGLYLLANRSTEWVPYVAGGVAGVIIGVITYLHPGFTDLTLVYVVASWAFIIGVFEIVAAIDMRGALPGAGWLGVTGALSVVFGIVVAFRPGGGMLAILWMVGFYAILAGVTRLVAGYRVHQFHGDTKAIAAALRRRRPNGAVPGKGGRQVEAAGLGLLGLWGKDDRHRRSHRGRTAGSAIRPGRAGRPRSRLSRTRVLSGV